MKTDVIATTHDGRRYPYLPRQQHTFEDLVNAVRHQAATTPKRHKVPTNMSVVVNAEDKKVRLVNGGEVIHSYEMA